MLLKSPTITTYSILPRETVEHDIKHTPLCQFKKHFNMFIISSSIYLFSTYSTQELSVIVTVCLTCLGEALCTRWSSASFESNCRGRWRVCFASSVNSI